MSLWILGDLLIPGIDDDPVPRPAIRVEDGVVREIRARDAVFQPPAGDEVLDLSGATLLPGLVDAHVHLCFRPDRSMAHVAEVPLSELFFRTLRNAQGALASGVTTIRDCGGRDFVTLAVRDAIDDGLVTGPRIHACAMPITTTRGHLHYCGAEADSADEMVKKVRQFAKAGVDYIKVCATGGRNTPGSNVFGAQYRQDQLTALVEDSHRLELKVASHALSMPGIAYSVAAGVDTIEHCTWYAPGGFDYAPNVVEEMIEKGIYAGFNFSGPFRAALDPDGVLDFAKIADHTGELRGRMREAGLPYFLSTDAGIPGMPHEDFALSIEVGARCMSLPPMEAIRRATSEPARAIGVEAGTVEVGRRADILAVNGNPLKGLQALRDVRAVIVSGRLVVERGNDATWLHGTATLPPRPTGEESR